MNFSADILVIGSGWAGYAAAMEAVKQGQTVIMVEKGPGASALSSGAIDVADLQHSPAGFLLEKHLPIEEKLQEIIYHEFDHPYSLLSRQMGMGSFFEFLRESIFQTTQSLPWRWAGDLEKNRLQITGFGNVKATALVPENMEAGNLLAMNQAKLLVVGIRGFGIYQSKFIKDFLLDFQSEQPVPYIQFAGNLDLEVPGLEERSSLLDFEIAQRLDEEAGFVPFAQALLSYLQGKVYTHVIFPPVLGVVNTELIIKTLKRITGLNVAETLGSPITIPGIRLKNAMTQSCEAKGVQVLRGEVKSVLQQNGHIQALELESNRNIIRLDAKAFVLASGKYLGGGIKSEGSARESIFNAELNIPPDTKTNVYTKSDVLEKQMLWKVGLKTTDMFQAFSKGGVEVFQNLFAAGSVLGGYDYIHGRCGAGVAICTGFLAGRNASTWIKESS